MSGKDNRVGKDTERRVATFLRENGWPQVERTVRTGYRIARRTSEDQGDLTGTPGLTFQVKSMRPATEAERLVPQWLAETADQAQAAGGTVGVLVVRRWGPGHATAGSWWAYVDALQFLGLADGWNPWAYAAAELNQLVPVRLRLSDLTSMLRAWGFGEPWPTDTLETTP